MASAAAGGSLLRIGRPDKQVSQNEGAKGGGPSYLRCCFRRASKPSVLGHLLLRETPASILRSSFHGIRSSKMAEEDSQRWNLVADLGFWGTAAGLGQVPRQSTPRREDLGQTGGETMELLTGESRGILEHAEILLAVNKGGFSHGMDSRLLAAAERQFFDLALAELRLGLIPGRRCLCQKQRLTVEPSIGLRSSI